MFNIFKKTENKPFNISCYNVDQLFIDNCEEADHIRLWHDKKNNNIRGYLSGNNPDLYNTYVNIKGYKANKIILALKNNKIIETKIIKIKKNSILLECKIINK